MNQESASRAKPKGDPDRFRRVHAGEVPRMRSNTAGPGDGLSRRIDEVQPGQFIVVDPDEVGGRTGAHHSARWRFLRHRVSLANGRARADARAVRYRCGVAIERDPRGVEVGDMLVVAFAPDEAYLEAEAARVKRARDIAAKVRAKRDAGA